MADTTPTASHSEPGTPPSSVSDQARIRKERREAKIKAGGSARLDRITGLGGGVKRDPPPQATVSTAGDPDEVDISQHYYEPKPRSRPDFTGTGAGSQQQQQQINDDQLRQMMLGFDPSGAPPPGAGGANPFAGFPGMEGGAGDEDPMMKMLQQMMGGAGGPGGAPGAAGMPSFPGMPGQGAAGPADPYAYLWRIVHAIFALSLGLYIAFTTTFSGTRLDRERSAIAAEFTQVHFFWMFATVEVLLQSSRYFIEQGKSVQLGGVVGTVVGFLPQPWKGYVELVGRYSRIWTTITGDAFACVFVLGCVAWWKGAAA
ncbi:hypothetical protein PVAG01_00679 [Phlyctema vagabunda]|uniref:GET complex subunit GET2 n=1 Tax=Phlyctema vagabunda TaxID=108571 RepID=A0ABR4PUX6_9HELO